MPLIAAIEITSSHADPELREKLKHVDVEHIAASQMPYRVYKRCSGSLLHSGLNLGSVVVYLDSVTLHSLSVRPVRRRTKR